VALALGVQCAACATMRPSTSAVKSARASRRATCFETVTIGRMLKEIATLLEGSA
jgi:hypothetical protein